MGIDSIDLPADQQRVDIDEEKLDDLAESIRDQGLINPVTVRRKGERFELIAGSRRLLAHKRLGRALIEVKVIEAADTVADVLQVVENEFRHDINPLESAIKIKRLMEKYQWDAATVAKAISRRVEYVEARLEILEWPEYILEPLAQQKLSLGAAQWLAKIEPDTRRRQYVIWGVQGGISVSQAHAWYMHSKIGSNVQNVAELPAGEAGSPAQSAPLQAECIGCRQTDLLENLGMWYLHEECYQELEAKGRENV